VNKPNSVVDVSVVEPRSTPGTPQGVVVGKIVGFAKPLVPVIEISGVRFNARTCVPLHLRDVGSQAVLAFESGRTDLPIVLGIVHSTERTDIVIEGETVTFNARAKMTLKCGKASVTLSRDGEVVVRGARVVSQASGANCIRGGSVELN
jgi:Domain of unknown function (DUF6484)